MAGIEAMFTLLHTLIKSTYESTISMNKSTLTAMLTYLQVMHRKVDMFKFQKKLLSDEMSLLRCLHSDFILLQHNRLFRLPIVNEQEGNEYVPTMNQIKEFVNDEDELHGHTQIRNADTRVNNELKKHEYELDKVTEKTETNIMPYTTKDKLKDDTIKIVRLWE